MSVYLILTNLIIELLISHDVYIVELLICTFGNLVSSFHVICIVNLLNYLKSVIIIIYSVHTRDAE